MRNRKLKKCWISTTQGGIEKGIALLLDVTPQFYEAEPIKYEKLSLWYLFHYVRPYKKAMIQLIIGLLAGLIGVGVTVLLNIPINSVLHYFMGTDEVSAVLPVGNAIVLVILSVVLTLIGGLIPSRGAAKRDPATALRTE